MMQTLSNGWLGAGAQPAREEARKQIYSSLPAWPEPELVLAPTALVTSSTSSPALSLSLSMTKERDPARPAQLTTQPNLRLVSLRAKLLGNKWEWLPLPPSFIKLKAVKRNGKS